jgi:uncharacterized repeat protein (TIGR03803 family)
LILSGSTLYGTTTGDGSSSYGTVFKLNTDGNGFAVLENFPGLLLQDALDPHGLALSGSTLYGVTARGGTSAGGGSSGYGTVFKLNTNGTGYTVLYNFTNSPDGADPIASLMLSGSTLYGTTLLGGNRTPGGDSSVDNGLGTVFKLNTDGTGYTVLNSFTVSTDGTFPQAELTLSGSTLYGTTYSGGTSNSGTVFKLTVDGTGYTVLHNFAASTDGAFPQARLAVSAGTLYGTTTSGGPSSAGTIFKLNTDGMGFTVLQNFGSQAGLAVSGSTLYGTTSGTIFKLNTDGTSYTVLTNSSGPNSDLVLSGNTLYGTTRGGGDFNRGTIFKLNTDGTGYTVLYSFSVYGYQTELLQSGSTLYGTTTGDGRSSQGTVFSINTGGTGYTVLYNFTGVPDGRAPYEGVTLVGSTLYGTTVYGGSLDSGTLFKLNTDGTGYTVLKSFSGSPDGAFPEGGLILSGGTLYGTTANGGILDEGAVFSLNAAPVLNITAMPGPVVLSWNDPAFNLQSAPEAAGPYTNIRGATSPYTDSLPGHQKFFRLIGN